ncbi:MAG: TraB/GumN family protein [Ignavibacteriales bacterium]|nr:TraB/GumN family protein [Ignavibacteriales bacterium]
MGKSLTEFDNIKPFFILYMMMLKLYPDITYKPLDLTLLDYGKFKNKTIVGVETIEEHNEITDSMSNYKLIEFVDKITEYRNFLEELIVAYSNNDLDALCNIMKKNPVKVNEGVKLNFNRNQIISNNISQIICYQKVFIAIGTEHLLGENGIIKLLREKGFVLEPIPLKVNKKPKKAQESE